jgi:hypothetical protein
MAQRRALRANRSQTVTAPVDRAASPGGRPNLFSSEAAGTALT